MIIVRYFKQAKKFTLHNSETKESVEVHCNYLGFSDADLFTGIKSINGLNNQKIDREHTPILPSMQFLSNLGIIFPIATLISTITGVVVFITYLTVNIFNAALGLAIALVVDFVIFILANYFMQLFVYIIPGKRGWQEAYIDDLGKVSVVDKKSGKTIPFTFTVDGKKHIELISHQQSEEMWDVFDKTFKAKK